VWESCRYSLQGTGNRERGTKGTGFLRGALRMRGNPFRNVLVDSSPLMPICGMAAAVEAGNDSQRFVGFDDEHYCVRIAAQQSSADAPVNDWELPGFAIIRSIRALTAARKCRPSPGDSFSYQSCALINSARAGGVKRINGITGNEVRVQSSEPPMSHRFGDPVRGLKVADRVLHTVQRSREGDRLPNDPKAAKSAQGAPAGSVA